MQHYSYLAAYAVYAPPFEGMPWLSVTLLPDGAVKATRFSTREEADLQNRLDVNCPPDLAKEDSGTELYARVLREALRQVLQSEGSMALDRFLERAKLVLMVDMPNIAAEERTKNALAFESVQRDIERVRKNPATEAHVFVAPSTGDDRSAEPKDIKLV